jgi:catechol 2,3-dioxygenase-like lactoylglutathione lyase family enzyme
VALWVADVEAALEFYRGKLGFELRDYEEGKHAFLASGDFLLVLFNRVDPGTPLGEQYLARTGGPQGEVYHIAFRVVPTELDAFGLSLTTSGLAVKGPVEFPTGRRSYFFEDLDQHYIELTDR